MSAVVEVSLACNDANGGSFVGHCEAIDFDWWTTGEHVSMTGKRVRVFFSGGGGKELRVSRRRFTGDNRRRWRGNWCWDSIGMSSGEAVRLLNYLREIGWTVTEQTEGKRV